jgi:hypothetical protein
MLFDYLNNINTGNGNIMTTVDDEKAYSAFMVNRGLSYFPDTVLQANLMNIHHHTDNRLQYDFLRSSIRKKKRYSKWFKNSEDQTLTVITEYYNCSMQKAKEYSNILSDEDIKAISEMIDRGGFSRKKAKKK